MAHTEQTPVRSPDEIRAGHDIFTDLRSVFDPLVKDVALVLADNEPSALLEDAAQLPRYLLPNSEASARLPWDVFSGVDLAAEMPRPKRGGTTIPGFIEDRELLWPWIEGIASAQVERHPEMLDGQVLGRKTQKVIRLEMELMRLLFNRSGDIYQQPFDPDRWHEYEQAVAKLPDDERAEYEYFQDIRALNVGRWKNRHHHMRQTDRVVYAYDSQSSDFALNSHIVLPVGAYGLGFTNRLLNTLVAANRTAEQLLDPIAGAVAAHNDQLISNYTIRALDTRGASKQSIKYTVEEGNVSIAQTIAMITAEAVPGYDDPAALVHDLADQGVIERVARRSPLGLVAPMALSGSFLPGAIQSTEAGLALSDEFKTFMKIRREHQIQELMAMDKDDPERPFSTKGFVCPLSGENGGISIMSKVFARLISEQ